MLEKNKWEIYLLDELQKIKHSPLLLSKDGFFGKFGGSFIPEILYDVVLEFKESFFSAIEDESFIIDFARTLNNLGGRPTPLYLTNNFNKNIKASSLFLKREDLLHTGAHKFNNALGQALLAKKNGKIGIIAETGAGQHGFAVASVAAYLGLKCKIFMGAKDIRRQLPNVQRMKMLGAEIIAAENGLQTLKEAVNMSMREWSTNYKDYHYIIGSALGPDPFPSCNVFFQSIIGIEVKYALEKMYEKKIISKVYPDIIISCLGGGSNSLGIFGAFIDNKNVELVAIEAGGQSINSDLHAARFAKGEAGILHGMHTYILQDEYGQTKDTHSISAGLDYAAVSPQQSYLFDIKRVKFAYANDTLVLNAALILMKSEGIIPALESSHALAWLIKNKNYIKDKICIVNLSGSGLKDMEIYSNNLNAS